MSTVDKNAPSTQTSDTVPVSSYIHRFIWPSDIVFVLAIELEWTVRLLTDASGQHENSDVTVRDRWRKKYSFNSVSYT
jgi:hypothetical protein